MQLLQSDKHYRLKKSLSIALSFQFFHPFFELRGVFQGIRSFVFDSRIALNRYRLNDDFFLMELLLDAVKFQFRLVGACGKIIDPVKVTHYIVVKVRLIIAIEYRRDSTGVRSGPRQNFSCNKMFYWYLLFSYSLVFSLFLVRCRYVMVIDWKNRSIVVVNCTT